MKDYKPVFKELDEKLRARSWFTEEWDIRNLGTYMHVYKQNWFNDNMGGVHIETYVEKAQLESKQVPIVIHCEDEFPKQDEFVLLFTGRARSLLSEWKGYRAIGDGYRICEKSVPLDPRKLADSLAQELDRLQQLAPLIDQTIADVLKDK